MYCVVWFKRLCTYARERRSREPRPRVFGELVKYTKKKEKKLVAHVYEDSTERSLSLQQKKGRAKSNNSKNILCQLLGRNNNNSRTRTLTTHKALPEHSQVEVALSLILEFTICCCLWNTWSRRQLRDVYDDFCTTYFLITLLSHHIRHRWTLIGNSSMRIKGKFTQKLRIERCDCDERGIYEAA